MGVLSHLCVLHNGHFKTHSFFMNCDAASIIASLITLDYRVNFWISCIHPLMPRSRLHVIGSRGKGWRSGSRAGGVLRPNWLLVHRLLRASIRHPSGLGLRRGVIVRSHEATRLSSWSRTRCCGFCRGCGSGSASGRSRRSVEVGSGLFGSSHRRYALLEFSLALRCRVGAADSVMRCWWVTSVISDDVFSCSVERGVDVATERTLRGGAVRSMPAV